MTVRARNSRLGHEHRFARIRIRHAQRTAARKRRRRILGHRPAGVAADHRRVVLTGIAPTGCRRSGNADQPRGRPRSHAGPGHHFRKRYQFLSHLSGDRDPAALQNNKIPSRIDAHRPVRDRHLQRPIRQHTCRRHLHVGAQGHVSSRQRCSFGQIGSKDRNSESAYKGAADAGGAGVGNGRVCRFRAAPHLCTVSNRIPHKILHPRSPLMFPKTPMWRIPCDQIIFLISQRD